jgi:glucose-6-phosphate 1-dehydrogenase
LTEINIHFKRTPHALFARTPEDVIEPNVMTLRLQPDEAIRMTFGAKRPGTDMRTGTVQMDFAYETGFGVPTAAAYETLLLDAMRGDATLFTRRDEVEAEWKLITPIEDAWQEAPPPEFPNYDAGTDGPVEADEMLAREGHAWRPLTKGTNLVGHLRTKGRTGVLSWPVTRRLR